jgi:hypothetical protein
MIHRYLGVLGILLMGMTGCAGSPSNVARSPEAAITKIPNASDDVLPAKKSSTPQLVAKQNSNRRTVVDYFLAMPAKYLTDPASGRITGSKRQQMLVGAKRGENGGIYDLKYTIVVALPRTARNIEVEHQNEDGSKEPISRYRFEGQRFVKE